MNNVNLFAKAIEDGKVESFLVGDGAYFFDARNDNDEPQNVAQAFDLLVCPYWRETKETSIPDLLVSGLIGLLNNYPNRSKAIYVVVDWVWCYCYRIKDKERNPNSIYGDLFSLQLGSVSSLLKERMEDEKEALKNDKRWAGSEWNSDNGMWGPLLKMSLDIRDNLGGPNFVPVNA